METMIDIQPVFWHWWIAAAVLLTIEILAPTFYALWLAISAALTGVVMFFFPELAWQSQLFIFAVLSVLSTVAFRNYYRKNPIKTDEPLLNRRGEQYVGRVITLKAPIVDGQGKVQIDDSTWKVEGPDCAEGTKIKIISVNNVVFTVEVQQ